MAIGPIEVQSMRRLKSPLLLWSVSLVAVWCAVAFALDQPLWTQQSSRELMAFGVIKGEYFSWTQSWKLIASQWLHVKAPHMLLNALVIGGVGLAAEARWGRVLPGTIALAGGTLSQALLVFLEPQAFLSGASQAYMALCGFVIVAGRIGRVGLGLAWVGLLIGFAIDLLVSDHGQIKVGHAFPCAFGIAVGLLVRALTNAASDAKKNNS